MQDQKELYYLEFPQNMHVLGHKGSGTFGEYGNKFRDNSIGGILKAIGLLDGAEFDLQMSADSTLWLFHDHVMLNCNGELANIASMTDSSIKANSVCNYASEVDRLEDLVKALDKAKYQTKMVSLDLKVLQNPESISSFGGEAELAMFIAEKINPFISEMNTYEVFLEVPCSSQVHLMESITGRTTFLIHNSFEYLREPLRMNHSSPIHHFYKDVPQLFDSYEQKSLLWVVNSADEMMHALTLKPTAIQTDNIPMVQFFRELSLGGQVVGTTAYSGSDSLSDFFLFTEVNKQISEDQLVEVNFGQNNMEGVHLVFSSTNPHDESTKWKSVPIREAVHYLFIGAKEHELLGTEKHKIYLWNPEGHPIIFEEEIILRRINHGVN